MRPFDSVLRQLESHEIPGCLVDRDGEDPFPQLEGARDDAEIEFGQVPPQAFGEFRKGDRGEGSGSLKLSIKLETKGLITDTPNTGPRHEFPATGVIRELHNAVRK